MEGSKNMSEGKNINKPVYWLFIAAGLSFLVFTQDISNATIFISLALAFDPFNIAQKWGDRPLWQKVWLVIHLLLSLGLFAALIFKIGSK